MPIKKSDLPRTLRRSPAKAQRTYAKTLDSAEDTYGDDRRAHQAAWAAVKHSFEKVGDRWEPKKRKGPSDSRAAGDRRSGRTAGGVDVRGHSRDELLERAKKLDIKGRWKMKKEDLGRAIARKQG